MPPASLWLVSLLLACVFGAATGFVAAMIARVVLHLALKVVS